MFQLLRQTKNYIMYCELRNTRKFCHCEAIGRGNPLTMQSEMRLLRGVYPALVAGLAMTKTRFIIQSHVVLTYSAVSHQERKHQRALNHSKTQHRAGNAVAVKEPGPKRPCRRMPLQEKNKESDSFYTDSYISFLVLFSL